MISYDVAFIGTGISALTSACLLAKAGKKVCLLERHYCPGGYLHDFKRFGHRFDTGAHYVGGIRKGQPFYKLLKYLGIYHEDDFIDLDPHGFDQYFFNDETLEVGLGHDRNIQFLINRFPKEEAGIKKFFERVASEASYFPTYNFNPNYDSILLGKSLNITLKEVVDEYITDPTLKTFLFAPCVLHGVAPKDISFGLHSLVVDSLATSSCGFRNGGAAFAKRYIDFIEDHGGEIFLKTNVEKIVIDEATKDVDHLLCHNGKTIKANYYVSSAHPKVTFDLIDEKFMRPAFKKRLQNINESMSVFGAYIILDSSIGIDPLKNYYFYDSKNPDELFYSKGKKTPLPVFLTCPDRTYKKGSEFPVTLHSPVTDMKFSAFKNSHWRKRPEEYNNLKEEIFREIVTIVESRFPNFSKHILKYETSSPLTNIYFNHTPNGAPYGIYHSINNTGVRALGPRTHFKSLMLTGQNTLFPGLLGSSISGLRTTGHIIGNKAILRDLKALE